MVGNLNQIGRLSIPSIHKISGIENGKEVFLHRFQGVAVPTGFQINHMAFDILVNRAKNLVSSDFGLYKKNALATQMYLSNLFNLKVKICRNRSF